MRWGIKRESCCRSPATAFPPKLVFPFDIFRLSPMANDFDLLADDLAFHEPYGVGCEHDARLWLDHFLPLWVCAISPRRLMEVLLTRE